MALIHVTTDNFDAVTSGEKTVLLDFYADWCGPCRMIAPFIAEIAEEREDVIVGKINVDNDPALAEKFGIFSIPTLIVMKNGEAVNKSVGAKPKAQILSMLEG